MRKTGKLFTSMSSPAGTFLCQKVLPNTEHNNHVRHNNFLIITGPYSIVEHSEQNTSRTIKEQTNLALFMEIAGLPPV